MLLLVVLFLSFSSLNSWAVRIPHNFSRRVCVNHAPNPWLEIGFKASLLVKQMVFQYLKQKHSKTNGFSTFLNENTIKHMFFYIFKRKQNKTIGFSTFLSENRLRPLVFIIFERQHNKTTGFLHFYGP